MKYMLSFCIISLLFLSFNNDMNTTREQTKSEILKTVKAHNRAWAVNENINEQMNYIHDDIQMIAPPYQKIIRGKQEYKKGYLNWMKHAKVHYYKEIDPNITLLKNGDIALVTFHIDMSFDYDSVAVNKWEGLDLMTLIKENGKWKIISDMYAKKEE